MANIFITNYCPRKCSFCFAKTRIGKSSRESSSNFMTRENLRKVMDFLELSNEKQLRLLGGEPTLHPEFLSIVDEAIGRGFRVHIFTNGMMPRKVADGLAEHDPEKISFLCNVSPQAKDTKEQRARVHYALEKFGSHLQLGVTLTEPEMEYEYLLDYIDRYKLSRHIRIGIAQPIVGAENSHLGTGLYRETGKFIARMALECEKRDVLLGFDCGLTLCMFSEEEIGILAKCSEGFKCVCGPIIDIGPDLDVWSCFPLAEVLNTKLEHFKTRNQIASFYNDLLHPYKQLGAMGDCVLCKYKKRNQCTGGCVAHTMNALNKRPAFEAPLPCKKDCPAVEKQTIV
ncbi:MAG: radical SAM protein [Proteobacteria bacterium]|nr:radical SAM protein [Pseudomonadota bacterium]MBU1708808.1 radical SAM protein [Pseudomonadota bacterium]